LKWPPGGGVRIKPTGVTSLNVLARPMSTLPLDCRACCHEGCGGGGFDCRDSGRLSALSSQVDLVGLHRLGSIVLDVKGLEGPSPPKLSAVTELVDLAWPYRAGLLGLPSERMVSWLPEKEGVVGLSVVSDGCTEASVWLELGRSVGTGPVSRLIREDVVGVMSLKLPVRLGAATLFRLLTIELLRLRPWGSCALHRFETLSDRLIMALCTNPPRPLVGDVERARSGDIRR
jgi:hypothetical protein